MEYFFLANKTNILERREYMNVDSYSTLINCYIIFEKDNFEIMSIYLYWKLKMDKYI